MAFKSIKEFEVVYCTDVGYLRKTLASDVLFQQIVDRVGVYFKGVMLRVDARIVVESAAAFSIGDVLLTDFAALLGKMNAYSIIDIKMRLSESCFDRWLEVPKKGSYEIAVPINSGLRYGLRRNSGEQDERASITSTKVFDDRAADQLTHIYIPSTDSKEIPIYPCEPFGVKKADPKSWSQKLLKKVDLESQSNSGEVGLKPIATNAEVECKAVEVDFEKQVALLKDGLRNPELRKALFEKLYEEGDRETFAAITAYSKGSLFSMDWERRIGKKQGETL